MVSRGSHYDVLGLARDASAEQIEKAYHFFSAMYADLSLATYSLLDEAEVREARARVRQAYEALKDPASRHDYDAAQDAAERQAPLVAPQAAPPPPTVPAAAPGKAPPRVLAEPVTGESLRRAREERGVSLRDVAATTKIGVRFLEYLEADRHGDLPALVYVRSFVQEYARALGLDPRRTADAYLARLPRP